MLKYLRSYRSLSLFNRNHAKPITEIVLSQIYLVRYLEVLQNENRDVPFGEVGSGDDDNGDLALVSHNGNGVTKSSGLPPTLICS